MTVQNRRPRESGEDPPERARLVVAPIVLVYAAAFAAWLRFGGAQDAPRMLAAELVFLPPLAGLVGLDLLASRNEALHPNTRRALRLLALGAAAVLAAHAWTVVRMLGGAVPLPYGSVVNQLVGYPFILAALLSLPLGGDRTGRWKFVCDAGMVLSGGGVAIWYFLVRPAAAVDALTPSSALLALLLPLADLILLVGIVTVLLRSTAAGNRRAVSWLALGAALTVVEDLVISFAGARGVANGRIPATAMYLATCIALLASAEHFWREPFPARGPRAPVRPGRLVSALPFLAAGATYLLLFIVAVGHWTVPHSGLAIGAIAVSIFLGARQLLSFRQSATLAAEAAVRASEARFRSLVQHSSDLIFVLGADGIIQFASSSASRLIGYPPSALVGVALSALAPPDDVSLVNDFIATASQLPGVTSAVEWRLRRPDGHHVYVEGIASNLLADDAVRGIVLNARDVGERKALLDQLAHQAFHDPLTGLANRALFHDRVAHALTLARRQERPVTVLYLDLDDFKQINDTLGHAEGDRLLTMFAARLRACARTTDTVARLGGDEFAILVEDTGDEHSARALVARITEQMAYPFRLAGTEVRVSASIGSAEAVEGGADEVLRHADMAMYTAKRSGRGGHRAFDAANAPIPG